jgi:hypothetical protein
VTVYATYESPEGNISNYIGWIEPATGNFRISQLPAGQYVLKVAQTGVTPDRAVATFRILPGQDTVLPQPIVLE